MSLYSVFAHSAMRFPNNNALWANGIYHSYAELEQAAAGVATHCAGGSESQVGILASRSITAYASVLGVLKSGKAYVPLNPSFPAERNAAIAHLAHLQRIIVGKECMDYLLRLAPLIDSNIQLAFPELLHAELPEAITSSHICWTKDKVPDPVAPTETALAYILFTSGSTGIPKGVPVRQSSVVDYVNHLYAATGPESSDVFSQNFDLTFDLSVHDMFLSWKAGACLCATPQNAVLAPAKFIKDRGITFWFSVPSTAQFMDKFRMLKPAAFPNVKYSMFCGESLPLKTAVKWQESAPNSTLVNIYGPTEATIGITSYTLPKEADKIKHKNGVVSIGKVFEGQFSRIREGENAGELMLSGSQVCDGYWENEEKTKMQFIREEGKTWYATGDLVELDSDGDMYYVARNDFQVKIRGYRIELEEINQRIQSFTDASVVFSMPWPIQDGVAENIYTFIDSGCTSDKQEILKNLTSHLPEYMLPKDIIFVAEFPLNSNGKIDRLELVKRLHIRE